MTAQEIRAHTQGQPLRPSQLLPADGHRVLVPHCDLMMQPPNGRLIDVHQPDSIHSIPDAFLILGIEFSATAETPRGAAKNDP